MSGTVKERTYFGRRPIKHGFRVCRTAARRRGPCVRPRPSWRFSPWPSLSHISQGMRAGLAPSGSMLPVSFGACMVVCGHLQYFGAVWRWTDARKILVLTAYYAAHQRSPCPLWPSVLPVQKGVLRGYGPRRAGDVRLADGCAVRCDVPAAWVPAKGGGGEHAGHVSSRGDVPASDVLVEGGCIGERFSHAGHLGISQGPIVWLEEAAP